MANLEFSPYFHLHNTSKPSSSKSFLTHEDNDKSVESIVCKKSAAKSSRHEETPGDSEGDNTFIEPKLKRAKSGESTSVISTFSMSAVRHDELLTKVVKAVSSPRQQKTGFESTVSPCTTACDQDAGLLKNKDDSLIVEARELAACMRSSIGDSWYTTVLQAEFAKPCFTSLSQKLAAERARYAVFPPLKEIFTWTSFSSPQDTKVVVIGQVPYHGAGQAHGLCFSVPPDCKIPPSLQTVYEELKADIPEFQPPSHGCLRGWAAQGVLLLNSVLTVRAGQPNGHQSRLGWETLTDAVVDYLNEHCEGIVFMLWGQYAQAKCANVDSTKHLVLTAAHPSPMAGGRFRGCKHFSKCNKWLVETAGKTPIDWNDLPAA